MSIVLPLSWILQMSMYDVNFGGDTVITRVADRVSVISTGISELKSELNSVDPIVGIDIVSGGDLLLLYVKKRCLIVQFKCMMEFDHQIKFPDSLNQFLVDKNVTFVGPRNFSNKSTLVYYDGKFECCRVVDIGYLAAKSLKKPMLLTGTQEDVVVEAGLDVKKPIISKSEMRANWQSSLVLSDEEVKYAMYEVYSTYQIAAKLTDVYRAESDREIGV